MPTNDDGKVFVCSTLTITFFVTLSSIYCYFATLLRMSLSAVRNERQWETCDPGHLLGPKYAYTQ